MAGLGTLANTLAVFFGGLIGICGGRFLTPRLQETLLQANAVVVIFIGIGGTLQQMFHASPDGTIYSSGTMMLISSMAIGAIIGEIIDIDGKMEKFGQWLKHRSGSENDNGFVNAFVTSSLTVCIGAMAVIGAIQDGIFHDPTTLYAKSVLDFIIIMVMSASLGKGCIFSAIPIFVFIGGMTAASTLIAPLMTPEALNNLSYVGNVLIFCVGWNLLTNPKIRVANLLPSLIIAIAWAFIFPS